MSRLRLETSPSVEPSREESQAAAGAAPSSSCSANATLDLVTEQFSEEEMLAFLPPEMLEEPAEAAPEPSPEPPSTLPAREESTPVATQVDPAPAQAPQAQEPPSQSPKNSEALDWLRNRIQSLGTKGSLQEEIKTALKSGSLARAKILHQVDAIAKATDSSREEVMSVLGFKPKEAPAPRQPRDPDAAVASRPRKISNDPDDPSSPNYRYRDTGYVAGSRKELAADMIRRAGREGVQLKASQIDWETIERNPRLAQELITKSNLFGTVDWAKLREDGMDPGAAFLIDRVYASVGKEPSQDSPSARRDYAVGLEILRERMEACRTSDDVTQALEKLKEEFEGITLTPEETQEYADLRAVGSEIRGRYHAFYVEDERLSAINLRANSAVSSATYEQEKRIRRGWKADPELNEKIAELKVQQEAAFKALESFRKANPYFEKVWIKGADGYSGRFDSPMMRDEKELYGKREAILAGARARNLAENPFHRGLNVMGDRFIKVLNYRSSKGSDAFANHVATVKADKVRDWSWSEKDAITVERSTKQSVQFQLKVADQFERVGGRNISVESSEDLKNAFGLREIQSGNYVLADYNSAKFHIEKCGQAFGDLADIMGVADRKISLDGQLAMAFGARGRGNAGWKGAAMAQYDLTYRIVNLTKNKGGGCLGHEWFHGKDNILAEVETGIPGKKHDFVTENPDLLPDGKLKDAVRNLMDTIWRGQHRITSVHAYTAEDYRSAQRQLNGYFSPTRAAIVKAGSIEKAIEAIEQAYPVKPKEEMVGASKIQQRINRQNMNNQKAFTTIAVAWYGGNPEGGELEIPISKPMSSFALEAHVLDGGKEPYWATNRELAARAFHAYCEDHLKDQGRKSDYLAVYGSNEFYRDPFFGDKKPYPEGEERIRINKAFDRYLEALRESKMFG